MSVPKVLVVDDDKLILQLLESKLTAAGYEVFTAVDPSDAATIAHEFSPDLFILDLNFPSDPTFDWHGFRVAEWLRYAGASGRRPVIFITVDDIEEHKARAQQFRPSAIFGKPMNLRQLLTTMQRFLSPANLPPTRWAAPVASLPAYGGPSRI